MQTKSKALILLLCAMLLVVSTVFGTIAYLTSEDKAVNTFTVGNVSIKLDEADVNLDGTPIEGADRVDGNEYHLIPGQTYIKDPTVTVLEGSENSYIRMLVTINKISELKLALGDDFLPENYVTGWDSSIWSCVANTDNGDNTITYEFRYYKTVDTFNTDADIVLEPLFKSFTLPGEITGEELAKISNLEITVVANAIQSLGFDDADTAWVAFDEQMNK
ncbi:MAG: SipW-dependent-type signal peptide-containing protein [Acutalibacteraceae bacterium]|nr:SipW-dependent-type signal peptide-containing protein [Acutalibacteraceae bacterium]